MNSSFGPAAVRSCLLLLLIHMSAPLEAQRVQRRRLQPPSNTEQPEGAESIPLDLTPVKANADDFLVQLKNLTQSLYSCSSKKLEEDMRLHFLKNTSVTCNDGSPAGYCTTLHYLRELAGVTQHTQKKKIIDINAKNPHGNSKRERDSAFKNSFQFA